MNWKSSQVSNELENVQRLKMNSFVAQPNTKFLHIQAKHEFPSVFLKFQNRNLSAVSFSGTSCYRGSQRRKISQKRAQSTGLFPSARATAMKKCKTKSDLEAAWIRQKKRIPLIVHLCFCSHLSIAGFDFKTAGRSLPQDSFERNFLRKLEIRKQEDLGSLNFKK